MPERSYTVSEIDELREVIEHHWLYGSYRRRPGQCWSQPFKPEEKADAVNKLVRAHMLAGYTAGDLQDDPASA